MKRFREDTERKKKERKKERKNKIAFHFSD